MIKRFLSVILTMSVPLMMTPVWSLPVAAAVQTFVPDEGSGSGDSEDDPWYISTQE